LEDDFLKYSHEIEKEARKLASQMIKELDAARATIIGKLNTIQDEILKGKEFDEATITRRKAVLEAQRNEISKVLLQVSNKQEDKIRATTEETFASTSKATFEIINKALKVNVSFQHLDERYVRAWFGTATVEGLTVNEWLKKLEQSSVDRILKASRQAMLQKLSTSGMVKLLREEGFEGSYKSLEGLARTVQHSAANFAKEQTIQEGFGDLLEGWRYIATLDDRTCLECGQYDGTVFKKNEDRPSVPRHWRCRCTYSPVFKQVGKYKPSDLGSRPAVTGSDQYERFTGSYQQWMKHMLEKDPEWVREVLGPKKFDLFKKGKLFIRSMG